MFAALIQQKKEIMKYALTIPSVVSRKKVSSSRSSLTQEKMIWMKMENGSSLSLLTTLMVINWYHWKWVELPSNIISAFRQICVSKNL